MIVKIWYSLTQHSYIEVQNRQRLTNVTKEDIKDKLIENLEDASLQNVAKIRGATLEQAGKEFSDEVNVCSISHSISL